MNKVKNGIVERGTEKEQGKEWQLSCMFPCYVFHPCIILIIVSPKEIFYFCLCKCGVPLSPSDGVSTQYLAMTALANFVLHS